jgi:N-acetylglutamate synthase-like GNAT family acetyltransferase
VAKTAEQKSKVKIREMRVEDLEGVLAIERETKEDSRAVTYAPVPDSCIGGEMDASVVAEVGDKTVGFVLGRVVGSPTELRDVAWIELIGILPEYQHKGIGRKMGEAWKERCRKKGIKKVHVMVNWRDWWMLSFFESLGFCRGDLTDLQAEL